MKKKECLCYSDRQVFNICKISYEHQTSVIYHNYLEMVVVKASECCCCFFFIDQLRKKHTCRACALLHDIKRPDEMLHPSSESIFRLCLWCRMLISVAIEIVHVPCSEWINEWMSKIIITKYTLSHRHCHWYCTISLFLVEHYQLHILNTVYVAHTHTLHPTQSQ